MLPSLDEILSSDSSDSDSSDYDSDSEFFEMVNIIRQMIDLLHAMVDEEEREEQEARRRTKCRRRVKVKVKSETKSSRRRRLAKEKEQAEAESLSCSIARDCEEVSSDRRECSEEISDATSSKIMYTGAVLDVCYRKLGFYPEVESFVQHEMVNFPSVKGQYSYNQPPKLIMLDDAGQCKEIIRIDNWKRGQILKFLRENLKPTSGV